MSNDRNPPKRRYRAPQREAAALRTREAIVAAAKQLFEQRGWAATTIRSISQAAGVSQKTVEVAFGTKAAILQAAVDYAIRGDIDPLPMPQREAIRRMEGAPDAQTMLALHAKHLRAVNERSARLAWTTEQAAASDPLVEKLWRQMNHNRAFAVTWATNTLLQKPDRPRGIGKQQLHPIFWVALDWGTYRTLTDHAGLTPAQFEQWLRSYYTATLLAPARMSALAQRVKPANTGGARRKSERRRGE